MSSTEPSGNTNLFLSFVMSLSTPRQPSSFEEYSLSLVDFGIDLSVESTKDTDTPCSVVSSSIVATDGDSQVTTLEPSQEVRNDETPPTTPKRKRRRGVKPTPSPEEIQKQNKLDKAFENYCDDPTLAFPSEYFWSVYDENEDALTTMEIIAENRRRVREKNKKKRQAIARKFAGDKFRQKLYMYELKLRKQFYGSLKESYAYLPEMLVKRPIE